MPKITHLRLCLAAALLLGGSSPSRAADMPAPNSQSIFLAGNWRLQSAAQVAAGGAQISTAAFDAVGWYSASMPSTVLAALVKNGVYSNIFFGTNLAAIPTAPFSNSWWFRDDFSVSDAEAAGNAALIFDGINYRANIWLNGRQIADANQTFGAFRIFQFDVGGLLHPGSNVLAAEIFPPKPGDYTMGFVDWNPKPADHEMGLFRPVELHFSQAVSLDHVFVQTAIDHATWQSARLTISAELTNHTDRALEAIINGRIGDAAFNQSFPLAPRQGRLVSLAPDKNPKLQFDHAQLWWPWELGEPHLYNLELTATTGGTVSDARHVRFGIREISDYLTPEGYRGYRVNGKKILIRGGGWADEFLLRESKTNLEAQLQYVKAMNLNAIRLEGIWGCSQELYDLCDQYGLLIMPGWSCQWEWEDGLGKKTDDFGAFQTEPEMDLATNYLHDQVLWLRNHPSIFVWVLGSDKHPRPALETRYDSLLPTIDPTRPKLMSCSGIVSSVSGPSAVKMNGPYDYVTPDYWYLDKKNGGAFGYNTETGPGPLPPPLESLQRMIPAADLWPIDKVWNFHCARGQFKDMKRYLNAFDQRYGPASSVEEFAFKSQAANYEAIRAMFEAFAVNLPRATGIIQWMLNASWPKLYWQLYDYYLVPGGAFFGVQHGAAPFAVIYNYADRGVYLVNQTGKDPGPIQAAVSVYDLHSKNILDKTFVATLVPASGSQKIFDLSSLAPATTVYFLDLHAVAADAVANNFYWLSTKPDVLDESKTTWYVTPDKSFADFTGLDQLPAVRAQAGVRFQRGAAEVTLTNPSDTLAFFIELKIVGQESGQILTPVFWDDNYISLPPHSSRTLHARFPTGEPPQLKIRGWNAQFADIAAQRAD